MCSRKLEDMQRPIDKAKKQKKKMGAPEFPYTEELADEICEIISTSPYGLKRICAENAHFPEWKTIYKWVRCKPDFEYKYDQARQKQADLFVHDIMERSYDDSRDYYTDEKGILRPNSVTVARDKLISDNVKWYASKLQRKKWGDRTTIETRDISHEESLEDLDKK